MMYFANSGEFIYFLPIYRQGEPVEIVDARGSLGRRC